MAYNRDKRARAKARQSFRGTPRFAMMPDDVLTSVACRRLPHYAFRTLVAMAAAFNSRNNGDLSIPLKRARLHGLSEWQLYAGLDLLQRVGLIVKTRQGGKHPIGCSLYALEFRAIDACDKYDAGISATPLPRNTWADWVEPPSWRAEIKSVEDRVRGRGSRERARGRLRHGRPFISASTQSFDVRSQAVLGDPIPVAYADAADLPRLHQALDGPLAEREIPRDLRLRVEHGEVAERYQIGVGPPGSISVAHADRISARRTLRMDLEPGT